MSVEPETLALGGTMTLATHTAARAQVSAALDAGDVVLDWQAVDEIDSSALALVFHARREASSKRRTLRHEHLPKSLDALADLYGVADLIGGSQGATAKRATVQPTANMGSSAV
ncbi:MAG: STAS domain-containing protein [Gammaproteobacteria bacterium]